MVDRANFVDNIMDNSIKGLGVILKRQTSATIATLDRNAMLAELRSDIVEFAIYASSPKTSAAFILPYHSYNLTNLKDGWSDAKGHTTGAIAGYSGLLGEGIVGVYAGYERMQSQAHLNIQELSQSLDLDNTTYYSGLKYTGLLTTLKGQELYYRVDSQIGFTDSTIKETDASTTKSANPNTYSYGANVAVGVNFNKGKAVIFPEIAIGYQGSRTPHNSFAFANKKTYEASVVNFINTTASLGWFQEWNGSYKTLLETGAKVNLNREVTTSIEIEGLGKRTATRKALPLYVPFVNASLILQLNPSAYFTISYGGVYTNNSLGHTGNVQLFYLW